MLATTQTSRSSRGAKRDSNAARGLAAWPTRKSGFGGGVVRHAIEHGFDPHCVPLERALSASAHMHVRSPRATTQTSCTKDSLTCGLPRGLCAVPSIGLRCQMYDRSEQGSQTASARSAHHRSLLPAPQLTYICDLRSQQPKPVAPAGAQSAIRTHEVSPLGRLERVVLKAEQ
jgi:hypothetical protein